MITLALSVLLALLPAPPPGGGTVAGKVVLVRSGADVPDASSAVVWIEGARGGGGPAPAAGTMKSEQKKFAPRVVVVRRNSTVQFPNADSIYHNAFSVSGQNRFDLGLYRSGTSRDKQFEEPGLVRVYCNIHPQMVGFVMVVDSDFAAVTGPDGAFRFENVPAGTWTVKIWNEEGGEAGSPVTVRAGAQTPAVFQLDATAFRREPHKNKYGKEYPPQAGADDERY